MSRYALCLLPFLLTNPLYGEYLKKEYFVKGNDINLSVITHDTRNDALLYRIDRNRYFKRVRARDLLKTLHQKGYPRFQTKVSVVKFVKLPDIDLKPLQKRLEAFYHDNYEQIDIHSVRVIPKNSLTVLPKRFTFKIQPRNALASHGILSIVLKSKRQLFFEYYIDADVWVYKTKRKVSKGEMLSLQNLKRVKVHLDRFHALPLQTPANLEAKHHILADRVVTKNDAATLELVKRGERVNVIMDEGGLEIVTSATALRGGARNDIIPIQNRFKKKLKAKVIAKGVVMVEAPK